MAGSAQITDSKAGTHDVLVTLQTACDNSNNDAGCFMGFTASGGLTQAAADNFAVGFGRAGPAPDRNFAGGASFLVTVTGPTTFTAAYKTASGAGTARFQSSNIIIQVFD